jgi:hypothetical protein
VWTCGFATAGGLLRDVDPVSMDFVLKAGKGGDPPSTFDSSPVNGPNELDFSDETIPAKISQVLHLTSNSSVCETR